MLKAVYSKYDLIFKEAAITSRAIMRTKETYFLKVWDDGTPDCFGIGECGLFRGLSCDDVPDYEDVLKLVCHNITELSEKIPDTLREYPSIVFGLESALCDLKNGGQRILFDTDWTKGMDTITINGLVWMGDKQQMLDRVSMKLEEGFRCVKFKIGGIDFEDEVDMIRSVRKHFSPTDLEIRLDANGGFKPEDALAKIETLSHFAIHSIEQPIMAGQWEDMAKICKESPIDIALDEELIGLNTISGMSDMITTIRPTYIILKPSLCGGISGSERWIDIVTENSVGWWATSALESNIGLNAIAQWVSSKDITIPQGLGTGALYINNISSPIVLCGEKLEYQCNKLWGLPRLEWME